MPASVAPNINGPPKCEVSIIAAFSRSYDIHWASMRLVLTSRPPTVLIQSCENMFCALRSWFVDEVRDQLSDFKGAGTKSQYRCLSCVL